MVVTALVAEQLFVVTVTLYVDALVGVTVIDAVVAPLLHKQLSPVLDVNVALVPAHTVVALAVIVAVGNGVTVIAVADDCVEHPVPLLTVTMQLVDVEGLTTKLCVVPTTLVPSLQEYV